MRCQMSSKKGCKYVPSMSTIYVKKVGIMSCVKRCQMSKSQTPVCLCMWHKCVLSNCVYMA